MYMESFETHTNFIFDNAPHGWTLYLIDDYWREAQEAFEISECEPLTEDWMKAVRKYLETFSLGVLLKAIAFLPYYCLSLKDLNRLVLLDFPRYDDRDSDRLEKGDFIDFIFGDEQALSFKAFLIDVSDAPTDKFSLDTPGSKVVLPLLIENGVSTNRCAFYSAAGEKAGGLENIIKTVVTVEEGEPLRKWWKSVLGSISKDYFNAKTPHHTGWHDPSNLAKSLSDPNFLKFVDDQANRDTFGVWRQVAQVLRSDLGLLHKQYCYLCGKAFLESGGVSPDMSTFTFTALRGLAMGLGWVLPEPRSIPLTDVPDALPATFVGRDIDNTPCHGKCSTGNAAFEVFAINLRNWLQELESNSKGSSRLIQVKLHRADSGCGLQLTFSETLGNGMFTGEGRGVVTQAWATLHDCFSPTQTPIISNENRVINFQFSEVKDLSQKQEPLQ